MALCRNPQLKLASFKVYQGEGCWSNGSVETPTKTLLEDYTEIAVHFSTDLFCNHNPDAQHTCANGHFQINLDQLVPLPRQHFCLHHRRRHGGGSEYFKSSIQVPFIHYPSVNSFCVRVLNPFMNLHIFGMHGHISMSVKPVRITQHQVELRLMTFSISWCQRSRSGSVARRNLVNSIARESLKRFEPKLTHILTTLARQTEKVFKVRG